MCVGFGEGVDDSLPRPTCVAQALIVHILDLEVHGREVLLDPPHLHRDSLLPGGAGGAAVIGAQVLR